MGPRSHSSNGAWDTYGMEGVCAQKKQGKSSSWGGMSKWRLLNVGECFYYLVSWGRGGVDSVMVWFSVRGAMLWAIGGFL